MDTGRFFAARCDNGNPYFSRSSAKYSGAIPSFLRRNSPNLSLFLDVSLIVAEKTALTHQKHSTGSLTDENLKIALQTRVAEAMEMVLDVKEWELD